MCDVAGHKTWFFCFVKHQNLKSPLGVRELLDSLNQVKNTDEYKHMVEISQKKADADTEMKVSRDKARLSLKRGRWEFAMGKHTERALKYQRGDLRTEFEETE